MAKGSVNKVIILGRLGQDPEMRATASGAQVATLSVATTELGRKDPQTNQRGPDETEWNRCVLFGRNAENAAQYLKKGAQVYLEGRLRTNKWQDQSGNDRYTTEIVCYEMQFMGGGQQQQQAAPQQQYQQPQQQQQYQQQQQQQPQQQQYQQAQAQPQPQAGGFDDLSDDIPF